MVTFEDKHFVRLIKNGKSWKYHIPEYNEEEIELIRRTIFEWLYEAGLVSIKKHLNK